ncbi:MAG: response regulator transcription factor [Spirochaetia bacterium]|nr:response regulator transcription factor [Spirochaetia bacterium]
MTKSKIPNLTIGVIEDNKIFRDHFSELLKKNKSVKEVFSWQSAEHYWHDNKKGKQNFLFIDINLPGINGVELTRLINQKYPKIKIIIITVVSSEETILQALKAGAKSYIEKSEAPPVDFILETVVSGGAVISPTVAAKILNNFKLNTEATHSESLSQREMQILEILSTGTSVKKTAESLHISEKTLRNHIQNIYKKLNIHSQAEMMVKANEMGFL